MNRNGFLIVLEGVDNIGKTATKEGLVEWLELKGLDSLGLEFPYKGFEALRRIGKDKRSTHYERFLAHALSHSLTYPIIESALYKGKVVVVDRYWYSNLAYATTFAGIEYEYIRDLEGSRLQPIIPDLVVYLYSNGVFPEFLSDQNPDSDPEDAYDQASVQQRKQLLRAYQQVISREWAGEHKQFTYFGHNVDRYDTLLESVESLRDRISLNFIGKMFSSSGDQPSTGEDRNEEVEDS